VLDKKGKGYADAKWEAEVRQKLNAKNTQVTLSKKDQALVNEQLRKEAEIRKRISGIKAELEHGLELVHSLSSANVEAFRTYAPQIFSILLLNAFTEASVALVGDKSFNTFLVSPLSRLSGTRADVGSSESERGFVREAGIDPYLGRRCYIALLRSRWNPLPHARRTTKS